MRLARWLLATATLDPQGEDEIRFDGDDESVARFDRLDDTLAGDDARDWGERVAELIPLYRR